MSGRDEVKAIISDLKGYLEFQSRMGNTRMTLSKKCAPALGNADKIRETFTEKTAAPAAGAEKKPLPVSVEMPADLFESEEVKNLGEIRAELGECERCKLNSTRKTIVFGEGNPKAELVFVGEGPGKDEDEQGRPFVGKAGKLLDKIINAMGMKREDVYICNVVKCRPPDNRNPEPDEIARCEPFLVKQLKAVSPRVVVCLGLVAAKALLKVERKSPSLGSLRGVFHKYGGTKLMVTYHPAALLRNPAFKRPLWEDMQTVMAELKKRP